MSERLDLKAYFNRIGYKGDPAVDLSTFREIYQKHVTAIPFENFHPVLRIPVPMDIGNVQQKIVFNGMGGYCFESNTLLCCALRAIGFDVKTLLGRVLWNIPEDRLTKETHMLFMVTIDGKEYLGDVGFGAQTLTTPISFAVDEIQSTRHESYRIIEKNGYYILQSHILRKWRTLYRFETKERSEVDLELSNWYTSTNPDHLFTNVLTIAIVDDQHRYSLVNNKFRVHYLDGTIDTTIIEDLQEMKSLLKQTFQIKLPNEPKFERKLLQLVTRSQRKLVSVNN